MEFNLRPGKYVVAVSGGVDSVVLLHLLAQRPDLELVVAHFDHGIRPDSAEDRKLVQDLAGVHGLSFVYDEGRLGPQASEARARAARYDFLHNVRKAHGAHAVVTAHHQDDALETIILNLLRGTGRRGLSSLKSTDIVKRPLLHVSKKDLLGYARDQGLVWREDSTNSNEAYLRNYIRKNILPRFAEADREVLLAIGRRAHELNTAIGVQTANYLHLQPNTKTLNRQQFVMLPHVVAREVMAEWLLVNTNVELSRKLLERLVNAAKVGRIGSRVDINGTYWMHISAHSLKLQSKLVD